MRSFKFNLQMFAVTEVSTLEELKTAVAAGGEIKLTADITDITETIEISNTVNEKKGWLTAIKPESTVPIA